MLSRAVLVVGLLQTSFGPFLLPLPLYPLGFRGYMLFTSVDLLLLTRTRSSGVSKSYAPAELGLRLSSTGKLTLHGQWLSLGSGKLAPGGLSDAILWRVQ